MKENNNTPIHYNNTDSTYNGDGIKNDDINNNTFATDIGAITTDSDDVHHRKTYDKINNFIMNDNNDVPNICREYSNNSIDGSTTTVIDDFKI